MLVGLVIGIVVGTLRTYGGRLVDRCSASMSTPCARSPCWRSGVDLLRLSAAGRALARCHRPPAIVGLGVHLGAYVAETIRAGLTSVRRDQMRAALALGMTPASGDPHDHPAAGADPHAAGARLAVRHRHQGQRDRLGHRGAGAACARPRSSPARPTGRSSSTRRRCSSISCCAIRCARLVDRAYRRLQHLGAS